MFLKSVMDSRIFINLKRFLLHFTNNTFLIKLLKSHAPNLIKAVIVLSLTILVAVVNR